LNGKKLSLGIILKIRSIEAFDGSIEVVLSNKKIEVLSKLVCEKLLVEK
jgi:DtxR family Mn-dependent transcriptional regulator